MFRRPWLMLLVAATLACGACGSSGPPSKASFIASADGICQAGIHALQPITRVTSSTGDAVAERILRGAASTFTGVVNQLGALNVPKPLAASWRTYVRDVRREVKDISGMANAIHTHDGVSFSRDLLQARTLTAHAKAAIAGEGFSHCGQGR